jgi:aerobic-type carbon monoxide dehydrogenase small subunit (CoxS/CutS family)
MSAVSLLEMNPHPQREEIAEYMSGNLCRCGCYEEIIEAILALNRNED